MSMYKPIGSTGLRRWGGYVREEYLPELQGSGWKRTVPRMLSDPVLSSALLAIELLARQTTWVVVPVGEDSISVDAALFVEKCRHNMKQSWDEILSNVFSMLPWGFSLLELVYTRLADGRVGWDNWDIRSQSSLDGWSFSVTDEVLGVYQVHPETFKRVFIPSEKFLLFRVATDKGNPEGRSVLRGAYEAWYFASNLRRTEAISAERDATGLPLARVPATVIAEGGAAYDSYVNLVSNLRVDEQAGAVIPSDRDEAGERLYDLELLRSGERGMSLDGVIARYDQRMGAALLADVLLVGSSTSSGYNLARQKQELLTMAVNGYMDSIVGTVNSIAIPRLLKFNGVPAKSYPKLSFSRIEHVDLDKLGLFIERVSRAGFDWSKDIDVDRRLREQADLVATIR